MFHRGSPAARLFRAPTGPPAAIAVGQQALVVGQQRPRTLRNSERMRHREQHDSHHQRVTIPASSASPRSIEGAASQDPSIRPPAVPARPHRCRRSAHEGHRAQPPTRHPRRPWHSGGSSISANRPSAAAPRGRSRQSRSPAARPVAGRQLRPSSPSAPEESRSIREARPLRACDQQQRHSVVRLDERGERQCVIEVEAVELGQEFTPGSSIANG